MSRALTAFEPLRGAPAELERTFLASPDDWLPQPARLVGADVWVVPIGVARSRRHVSVTVGDPWRVDHAIWRALTWTPLGDEAAVVPLEGRIPGFAGELGLHLPDDGPPGLMLDGRYTSPGGVAGHIADRVVVHRIATRTARRLLSEIGVRLGRPAPGTGQDAAAEI